MDTIRYKAFLSAAELGSIRKAADSLGYTPSAVSQLIQALERDLNTTLLLRSKKKLQLTTTGAVLLPYIRQIVLEEALLLQTAAGMNGIIRGTINIASYHSLAASWLPSIILEFHRDYPDIQINIYEGSQNDMIDQLLNGKVELALFNDSAMKEKHDWILLKETPMVAVIPADHPMAGKPSFPIQAFNGERFIMTNQGQDYDVVNYLKQNHVYPDLCLSTLDTYTLVKMVEKGLGIGIVGAASLLDKENGGKWESIPIMPASYAQMGIAVLSLKNISPAVRKFIACAQKVIQAEYP